MFQVVAVKDVTAAVAGEPGNDLGILATPQVNSVFPAGIIGAWLPPVSGKDLEMGQVQVNGVVHVGVQFPTDIDYIVDIVGCWLRSTSMQMLKFIRVPHSPNVCNACIVSIETHHPDHLIFNPKQN